MDIKISKELSALCPGVTLMVLSYETEVQKSSKELTSLLDKTIKELRKRYSIADLPEITPIKDTRTAYRILGKSPTSYRNAAEAMLRRIIKGKGLYQINNVVEINNLISITTGYSVGSYDSDSLTGIVELRRSLEGESYKGIGKDVVNIANLPTLYDDKGAFGNPTSDSRRAMISSGMHRISSVIYSFSGNHDLDMIAEKYHELLETYCCVKKCHVEIID